MKFLGFLFCAVFLQVTTAQILSHIPRNNAPGQVITNQPTPTQQMPNANYNTVRTVPNNGIPNMVQNVYNNGISRTGNPNIFNGLTHLANNMANNMASNMAGNMASNMANNMANMPLANAPIANVMNEQAVLANPTVGITVNPEISNIGVNPNIATLANMANINGNMATFELGNSGFTVTSGSPGIPGFGIQVLADALEVGGRVAVNGQIPIFGAVTVNGHLPTDGSATVSYTCGRETASDAQC